MKNGKIELELNSKELAKTGMLISTQDSVLYETIGQKLKEEIQILNFDNPLFAALEHSNDGIALLDGNKNIEFINNSLLQIYGYNTKEEIISHSCFFLFEDNEYERISTYVIPELEKNSKWHGESYGLKKDGSTFPIESTFILLDDHKTTIILRDISEKKKIYKIVEENEEKYRLLFENSPSSIIIIEPETGKIIDFNKKAYISLEYSKNKFSELFIQNIQHLESDNFTSSRLKQILRSGYEQFETIFQTNKGDLRNYLIYAQTFSIEDKIYVQYLCTDITDSKQKNFKLIESEARYKALVEKSHDAILIYRNKQFVFFNDVASLMTGYSKEELSYINPLSMFIGYDVKKIESILTNPMAQSGNIPLIETIIITKDRSELNAEICIKTIPYEGVLSNLITIRNITNRKQLENAHKLLVDNSLQGLVIFQNGVAAFANKKIAEISGYSSDEFVSFNHENILSIIHKDDRQKSKLYMRARAISYEPPLIYQHRIIRKDATIRWVEVIASKIIYNGKPAIQAAYVDITDKKIAEEALLESEEKYKILVENAFDAIYLLTNEHFDYVNPRFCEITGYTYREVLDPNFDILSLLDDESVKIYNKRFIARKHGENIPNQYQMQVVRKDGEKIQVELSTASYGEKENVHVLGIMRDISERKKVEEQMENLIIDLHKSKDLIENRAKEIENLNIKLQESENNLRELNISKDLFFSIIAHDLKGPFSGFLGLSSILTHDIRDLSNQEIQEIANDLHESAEHLFRLLENLLQWSRIQRKVIQFNPEDISLSELTNLTTALLYTNAKQKNVKLINSVNPDTYVFADMNMLSTIIRNLISNAIKFTNSGDSITVSSKAINDIYIQVDITDTGIGMSEIVMQKLFRIDSQHTTIGTANEKGTGLGLILCKELIELNDGVIWVNSELGKGTTFSFKIPLSKKIENQ